MKDIYIILVKSGTIFSRTIGIYTRCKYNHASIALDDSLKTMYSFSRKYARNPFVGKFNIESKDSKFYHIFNKSECIVLKLKIKEEGYDSVNNEIQHFIKYSDRYGYNLIGLFGFIINKPIKRKDKFFCSQFVAHILRTADIYTINVPELSTPKDFIESRNIEIIYEGPLKDYCQTA